MGDYGAEDVICPFYKEETKNTITCEGVIGENCRQAFSDSMQKKAHKKEYCNAFNYSNCLHCKQLEIKYK